MYGLIKIPGELHMAHVPGVCGPLNGTFLLAVGHLPSGARLCCLAVFPPKIMLPYGVRLRSNVTNPLHFLTPCCITVARLLEVPENP